MVYSLLSPLFYSVKVIWINNTIWYLVIHKRQYLLQYMQNLDLFEFSFTNLS